MIKSLIVEDNAEFRGFLKGLLLAQYPGGTVEEAHDAAEALRLLGYGGHDLVVVDIGLSGTMNGLTLVSRIRESGRRAPILILSNYALPEYQLEAARVGADWFLPKFGSGSGEIIAVIQRLIVMGGSRAPES